jgi:hypothetical protein
MGVGPGLQGSSESSQVGGSIGRFRGGGRSSAVSQSYVVLPHGLKEPTTWLVFANRNRPITKIRLAVHA